ncbi:phage head closure protein [Cytobacillus horneckiae]|uniref:phage head closure protein n=1 Tax=Cytobacillus horneckiae TaxID=549687 RepID=UPI0034CDBCFB
MFKDVIFLIKIDKEKTKSGGYKPTISSQRQIFAEKKSTKQSEFYQALQNDLEVTTIFKIHLLDYDEERVVKGLNEKYYTVIRTYELGDYIELSCQRRLGAFEEAIR